MFTAKTDYKSVPDLVAAFIPEYKTEHFHLHGGFHQVSKQQSLISVFKDQNNQLHQGARLALKGGLIGLITGVFYIGQYAGTKNEFVHTRSVLGKISRSKRLSPFVTMGALAGLSWWVINDLFLCPHGHEASFGRYLFAHALQGGVMVSALYHPSAFGYGLVAGTFAGLIRDSLTQTKLPKNFKLYFPNFDEQKRRNKLRDDEQYQLSLRNVINSKRVFHPI